MGARPASYRPLSICDGLVVAHRRTPRKLAVEDGARALTYAELMDRVNRLANGVLALSQKRDRATRPPRVGILMRNRVEFIEALFGAVRSGGVAVPLNPTATAAELDAVRADADLDVLVAEPGAAEEGSPTGVPTIVLGEPYERFLAGASSAPPDLAAPAEEWDPFCISYTGGTTGRPKGVVLSHRSRVLTFMGMGIEYGCYSVHDRSLCVAPLYHGAGMAHAVAPIFFGGSCRIMRKFDPELMLRELAESAATNVFLVPTHFAGMFSLSEKQLARYRGAALTSLKALISNAAPLTFEMKTRIVEQFGPDVLFEAYGSTEGGTVTMIRPEDQLRKPGSVGLPFICTEIIFVDDGGHEVEDGDTGELFSRSPYLFSEYLNLPEQTEAALVDGWFSAGDIGFRDDEGYVHLVDRKDDKIITGGVNVFPREVEAVLLAHPAVVDAAVFGIADAYWGETVQAAVVLGDDADANANDLLAFCRERLSDAKRPKAVHVCDKLPRTETGKMLRRQLRDEYAARERRTETGT